MPRQLATNFPRRDKTSPGEKCLLSAFVLAFGASRNQDAASRLEDFASLPGLPVHPGEIQLPLQLAINEAQALALGFHKVLLGQQSHQLGCLKFYHQHSSSKCWARRLLVLGQLLQLKPVKLGVTQRSVPAGGSLCSQSRDTQSSG